MKAEEIPQELTDILDRAAGMNHSRTGSVMRALAEILTRYDEIRARTRLESLVVSLEDRLGLGPIQPAEPFHPSMNGSSAAGVPGAGGGHHGQ
jgi:hypothetical protein